MNVKQVAAIVNSVQQQIVGENAIQTVDLEGLIDMGKQALDATSYDNYVKTLVDHIGKVVFVNRAYQGSAPSVLMDGWEYGAILEKISSEMPAARTPASRFSKISISLPLERSAVFMRLR